MGAAMRLNNPVKETLRAGGSAIGVFIPIPSPDLVEIVALAGFDFALLDAEHGRISPDDAYPMVLAAEARNIPALVRVGENDRDRKSTRLNSSHLVISYAVFCLKKKRQ